MPPLSELELILSVLTHDRGGLMELLSSEFASLAGALDPEASTDPGDPLWIDEAQLDFELLPMKSALGFRLARLPEIHLRAADDTPDEFEASRQRLKILRSAIDKRGAALTAIGRYLATEHTDELRESAAALPQLSSEAVALYAGVEERLIARVSRKTRCRTPRGELDLCALFES